MTLRTSADHFAGNFLLRTGLLALLLIGFWQPTPLKAAPIVFEATTLVSNGCGSRVSGQDFSFDGIFENLGNGCGGRLASVGIPGWPLPGQATNYYQPVVVGTVNVPENPADSLLHTAEGSRAYTKM